MKKCRYCAEEIQDEAIVCRYCGGENAPKKQKKITPLWMFFIVTVLFVCICILAAILGNKDRAASSETDTPETSALIPTNTLKPTNTPKPTNTLKPTNTPKPINTPRLTDTKQIIPAGQLAQYVDTYSSYDEVFVTKLDGSIDTRPNDLEELCLDWLFYRDRIIEYTVAGKTDKANDARTAWKRTNYWLDEYNENDVSTMFSIIENRNK